ncbi:MAG: PIN domain-containing protein [Thermoplasmata archaeon]
MKALDTPVLLEILHDSPRVKELLKGLRGEELATTEINLFELRLLAVQGGRTQREARETALARLRRRITVLPVTAESVRAAGPYLTDKSSSRDFRALVWGTLAAAGCGEWITSRSFAPPKGGLPFKVRIT